MRHQALETLYPLSKLSLVAAAFQPVICLAPLGNPGSIRIAACTGIDLAAQHILDVAHSPCPVCEGMLLNVTTIQPQKDPFVKGVCQHLHTFLAMSLMPDLSDACCASGCKH